MTAEATRATGNRAATSSDRQARLTDDEVRRGDGGGQEEGRGEGGGCLVECLAEAVAVQRPAATDRRRGGRTASGMCRAQR